MPADITGFSVFNPKTGEFDYRPGAILSQIVLADETSPKTQSSLLEVMEENQVTVDGNSYPVPEPFIVLATQNPVEYLGTYPLPEAQLDRFFMKISLGYPSAKEEGHMLERFREGDPMKGLQAVASGEEIRAIQSLVETVYVSTDINNFIVNLTRFTREHNDVVLGASPRASLCLFKASQAWALYNSRDFVTPDDVISMAAHVLEHRIILKQEAKLQKRTALDVVEQALKAVRPPV
jgi:MoxR-like ATPase